jgi:hypothetical protein
MAAVWRRVLILNNNQLSDAIPSTMSSMVALE